MNKQALLVIDMLNDFVREGGALYIGPAARGVISEGRAVIEQARVDGVPVVYLCDRHRAGDAEFNMFAPHCLGGSEGAEIVAALQPRPGEVVIPKRRYSAFFGTELELLLREMKVKELTLVGVCTNICVLYTAADARMRGWDVQVPARAVASFDEEAHRFALREMENTLGVQVK